MHSSFTESLSCFWRFQGNKSLGGGKALSQNSKIPFPRCSHVLPAPPCQDLGKSSSTLVGRSPVCPPAALPSLQDFWKHRQCLGLIGISPAPLKKPSPEKMEKGDLGMLQRRWELDLDLHLPLLSLLCCKHNSIKSSFPSCPDALMELEQEFARDNGDLEG